MLTTAYVTRAWLLLREAPNFQQLRSQRFRLYEIDIGLIVGCMPVLPLFVKHRPGLQRVLSYLRSLPSQLLSHQPSHADISNGDRLTISEDEAIRGKPRHFIELKEDGKAREPLSTV